MKWGEYSSDVQFILQRSDQPKPAVVTSPTSDVATKNPASSPPQSTESPKKAKSAICDQFKPMEKSPFQMSKNVISDARTPDSARKADLIGIVKGVPHATMPNLTKISPPLSPCSSTTGTSITTSDFGDVDYATPSKLLQGANSPKLLEFNSADVRNSLDRKTSAFREVINMGGENVSMSYRNNNNHSSNSTNSSISDNNNLDSTTESYKNGPPISSNGALAPPPYRNPPPPSNSPLLHQSTVYNNLFVHHQKSDSQSSNTTNGSKIIDYSSNAKSSHFMKEMSPQPAMNSHQPSPNIHINALSNLQAVVNSVTSDKDLMNDNHFQNAQYRELLQLIQYQREKISIQQADISKVYFQLSYIEQTISF